MLLTCRDCGGQVSSGATSCPHCGLVPKAATGQLLDPKANARSCLAVVAVVFVVVALLVVVRALFAPL